MFRTPIIFAAIATLAAASASAAEIVTAVPLDATLRCFRTTLGSAGRLVTINTASGALLDFAFDTIAADGRPGTARITFAIDDRGAERHVSAAPADPADAPLADQLMRQAAKTCLSSPVDRSPTP